MANLPERKKPRWFRVCQYIITSILAVIVLGLAAGFIAVGTAAGFVASHVKEQPIPSKEELKQDIEQFTLTSFLFDKNGKPIGSGELRTANDRVLVKLKDVSPYFVDAIVATEDKEFFEHAGIVPRSLLRAAVQDLIGSSTTTGGSTITQQLVKLSVLKDPEKTYSRKAREIFLALRLERQFDKEDILTSYINRIYFGRGPGGEHLYGIEAAAESLFGVSAKDLNLAQAAYLAGMPQRPNAYSPLEEDTLKAGLQRQHTVLSRMLENGKITDAQFQKATSFDLKASLAEPAPYTYEQYPYLFEAVHKRAAEKLMELDDIQLEKLQPKQYDRLLAEYKSRLAEGGYRIHTTIDLKLYDALNEAVREYDGYKPDVEVKVEGINGEIIAKEQVGSVVIDVKTGALLAFVGGRDKEHIKNRALDAYKQPGSSAKPLLAYGPGMASGVLQPGTVLKDTPEVAKVGGHTVSNYAHNFHGNVTVREALKHSYNVAAIDAFRKVGIEKGYEFIADMGMDVPPEQRVPVGVLGVNGFSPEQMASAYAMFANKGAFNEPYLIQRIEDAEGSTVYEHKVKPKRMMSEKSAYLLTDVLRDVLKSGTGTWIGSRISGAYDVAGKTGTTQHAKDMWFVGYTPEIAMSVWVGYDYEQTSPVVRPNENLAKIMWTKLFHTIQETVPDLSPAGSQFERPDGLVSVSICKDSGKRAANGKHAPGMVYSELFSADQVPDELCEPKEKKQKHQAGDRDEPTPKREKPADQNTTSDEEATDTRKPNDGRHPAKGQEGDEVPGNDDDPNGDEPPPEDGKDGGEPSDGGETGNDPDEPPGDGNGDDSDGEGDEGSSGGNRPGEDSPTDSGQHSVKFMPPLSPGQICVFPLVRSCRL